MGTLRDVYEQSSSKISDGRQLQLLVIILPDSQRCYGTVILLVINKCLISLKNANMISYYYRRN